MQTRGNARPKIARLGERILAVILCAALGAIPLACGGDGDDEDQQALNEVLSNFGKASAVRLDTAALATAARAGQQIRLPFGQKGGTFVDRTVHLTPRNLRNPELTEFVLKDGDADSGSTMPLPPSSTYQGTVEGGVGGGVAVFTVTDTVVEGSMLMAPDGFAFIEPLEPQLRLRGVDAATRERLLKKSNHIVYNTADALQDKSLNDAPAEATPGIPQPPEPLVLSIVADGDAALYRDYPLDSVMPFWLKQETILNSVDWLFNCVEPVSNSDNSYARCDNAFDGGSGSFQARVRIDRLEVWTSGGPDSDRSRRDDTLEQSVSFTHQASPPCCGEPHTAGHSSLVHFFSGRDFVDGAGMAYVRGLAYYGELCEAPPVSRVCHHAVSQIVPGKSFRGTAFHQHSLVAHEIGHVVGAQEAFAGDHACWLGDVCGRSLMATNGGFDSTNLFLFTADVAEFQIGPLLAERLGDMPENP